MTSLRALRSGYSCLALLAVPLLGEEATEDPPAALYLNDAIHPGH